MIKFYKMHGIGNDYIYIDCFGQKINNPSNFAIKYSDRNFGIGGDGLVLIKPSDVACCKMEMYNADGSLGNMCGNAIRCVGKYMYDQGKVDDTNISIETKSGIKNLNLIVENNKVKAAKVDMGEPEFALSKIPVSLEADSPFILGKVQIENTEFEMSFVSMGNPHAIIYVDNVDKFDLDKWGKIVEKHPIFPEGINFEIVQIIDEGHIKMRVWERGSGKTLACGTGACACAVASAMCKKTSRDVTVSLPGGDLEISWDVKNNHVYMLGEASSVYWGYVDDYQ